MSCEWWLKIISLLIQVGTFVVLLCTLVKVIEYTKETAKLRKETVRQTELQLRPFVILNHYDKILGHAKSNMFEYKNIGKGNAIDLQIIPLENEAMKMTFTRINVLEPNRTHKIGFHTDEKDKGKYREFMVQIDPSKIPFFSKESFGEKYDLVVKYKNIRDEKYETIMSVNVVKKELEFISSDIDRKR